MTERKKINAIILNFNSANDTIELYQNVISLSLDYINILIIDNASDPNDQALLKQQIPKENLFFNDKNLGYAGGNNIGIDIGLKKGFQYSLILNPDIRINTDTIPNLLALIEQNDKVAAVGPRICYRNNKELIYSDGGTINPANGYTTGHINYNKKTTEMEIFDSNEVNYVNGSCMLINNNIISEIGCLKDYFFLYFEETEWCLRAKRNGFICLTTSKALAYHESSNKSEKYHFYMTRNRLLLAKIEKQFYATTKKKIWRNLMHELFNAILKGQRSSFWWTRMKGFLSGVFYKIN